MPHSILTLTRQKRSRQMASLANNSLQRLKSNSLCRACQGMMSQVIYTRGHRDDYRHHTSWKALKLHSQICSTCRFIASIEESFPTRTFGPLKDHSVYVSICSHIWDSPSSLMYIKYRGGERCLENKVMCVKTLEGKRNKRNINVIVSCRLSDTIN